MNRSLCSMIINGILHAYNWWKGRIGITTIGLLILNVFLGWLDWGTALALSLGSVGSFIAFGAGIKKHANQQYNPSFLGRTLSALPTAFSSLAMVLLVTLGVWKMVLALLAAIFAPIYIQQLILGIGEERTIWIAQKLSSYLESFPELLSGLNISLYVVLGFAVLFTIIALCYSRNVNASNSTTNSGAIK